MLIIVWADTVDESVIEEAKKHHCPIIRSGHGTMNTSRYLYFAPSVERIMKKNPVLFHTNELAEDVGVKMLLKPLPGLPGRRSERAAFRLCFQIPHHERPETQSDPRRPQRIFTVRKCN